VETREERWLDRGDGAGVEAMEAAVEDAAAANAATSPSSFALLSPCCSLALFLDTATCGSSTTGVTGTACEGETMDS